MKLGNSTIRESRHLWEFGKWVLIALLLLLVYGKTLAEFIHNSLNPAYFNDDVRQHIYPFFRYADPTLFPNDYVTDHMLAMQPIFYKLLFYLGAKTWDVELLSKWLPIFLLLITIAAVGSIANRLAGKPAAWTAMAICLSTNIFLDRMGGGLSRAFGFPLVAFGLALLVHQRFRLLAWVVILAAGLYPTAAVLLGLSMALSLLVLPCQGLESNKNWPVRRRIGLLVTTATISCLIIASTVVSCRQFGALITPAQINLYPEVGPGGRYGTGLFEASSSGFFKEAAVSVEQTLMGGERWIKNAQAFFSYKSHLVYNFCFCLILFLAFLGWLNMTRRDFAARQVAALMFATFIGYQISWVVVPYLYLPDRYVTYTFPLLAAIIIPTGVSGLLFGQLGSNVQRRRTIVELWPLLALLTMGGPGNSHAGLTLNSDPEGWLNKLARTLPKDALIAGWPEESLANIPYQAKRKLLITYETHLPFQTQFTIEMRSRMRALIDAYYATRLEPLIRLRTEFHVTHLLVHLPYLDEVQPTYFKPFDKWIIEAKAQCERKPLEILRQLPNAIFRRGNDALFDLQKLSPSHNALGFTNEQRP